MRARAPLALAAAIGAVFALASATAPVSDPHSFVTLALGRDALAGGPPLVEARSWTAAGAPLAADEWLGQLLFALAYEAGGWKGVGVLRALAGGAVVALAALAALREGARAPVAVLASLPAALLLVPVWTERPYLLALVLFAALIVLLRAAPSRPGLWWACVPLFLVWANVHATYALGLLLLALAVLAVRRRTAVLALAASAAMTLAAPAGSALIGTAVSRLLAPPRFVADGAVPDLVTPAGLVLALTLALVLAVALLGDRARGEALILVPVAFLALATAGNGVLLAIAAAPFLARRAPAALAAVLAAAGLPPLRAMSPLRGGAALRATPALLAVIAALALTAAALVAPEAPDLRAYPVAAVPQLRPGPGLLHELAWGGFVLWHAPATKVFVDGRLRPYVPTAVDDHTTIVEAHPGWRETIARLGVTQLLVRPAAAVAVRARELGWRESASGPGFVLIEVPR